MTLHDFDNINGIDESFFQYNANNNTYFTKASLLGEYPKDDFIIDRTLYFIKNQLEASTNNKEFGTFVINKGSSRFFFTFKTRITNEYSDKLIYKYIGHLSVDNVNKSIFSRKLVILLD